MTQKRVFWGSSHGDLPRPPHQKALEKSLGIKGQSCAMLRLSHRGRCGSGHGQSTSEGKGLVRCV